MKRTIVAVVITAIIFGSIGVYAGGYKAKDVTFTPSDSTWNVHDVEEAINNLKNNSSMKLIFYKASSNSGITSTQRNILVDVDTGQYLVIANEYNAAGNSASYSSVQVTVEGDATVEKLKDVASAGSGTQYGANSYLCIYKVVVNESTQIKIKGIDPHNNSLTSGGMNYIIYKFN